MMLVKQNGHATIPNRFNLPKRINRLGELAYNLWWVWNPEAQAAFYLIDRLWWDTLNHNPVKFLHTVDRERLNAVADDPYYLENYDKVFAQFDAYMSSEQTWFDRNYPALKSGQIAYFSFEFGLHESLPVYAGGLGILSGDHLKEASDMGIPIVGVGFIYTQGYFVQRISEDGWQETGNYLLELDEMPVIPLTNEDGSLMTVSVFLSDREVQARLWKVQVGRVPLYLLDTNVTQNSETDRQLTARLYSSDPDVRISQEILLGMGGVRALTLLGFEPDLYHMNEGHSAFLILERLKTLVAEGKTLDEAKAINKRTNIFTTHTPVPAGNDAFPIWLMDKYFYNIGNELGLTHDDFIDLGRHLQPWGDTFSMPVLALKLSDYRNGVSELHGQVSRAMWNFLWPGLAEDDVPITHITNGVHLPTWIARRMRLLFNRYLGEGWMDNMSDPMTWRAVASIPDAELWAVRKHLKRKLMLYTTNRARIQWLQGKLAPSQLVASGALTDPYALTIGFSRRFATYKRGNLVLRDTERLLKILNNPRMPVQIVFAGKAHPADEPGKLIIQQIYTTLKQTNSGGRIMFLEDYDMNMARYLVQGVDVWMNTPRRPNEASGTSGMKAAMNGVLNFSIADGWWHEAYNGRNGWRIGDLTQSDSDEEQNARDAASLYNLLENEIVPMYYAHGANEAPGATWMEYMKESIRTLAPRFSMERMLTDYTNMFYADALVKESDFKNNR